ncbi:MAG: hypothetical protein RLZZ215_2616, partial [Pseudomonadota bacterium]
QALNVHIAALAIPAELVNLVQPHVRLYFNAKTAMNRLITLSIFEGDPDG